MEVATVQPKSRKRAPDVLFTVERRTPIGEVYDGEGNLPPITAGLSVIAQELELQVERARYTADDQDHDNDAPSIRDTFAFTWQGNTYTVNVNPEGEQQ